MSTGGFPAPPKLRLDGLQWLRGASALLVVLFHVHVVAVEVLAVESVFRVFEFGAAGVDIFFVLSGFIIYYIHHRDLGVRERARLFLKKRLLRIYPIYWILTLGLLAVAFALSLDRLMYKVDLSLVLHSLFLVPIRDKLLIIPVAWSLTHEVLFYGYFFAMIALPRRVSIMIVGLIASMTVLNVLGSLPALVSDNPIRQSFWLDFLFSPYNLEFLMGVAVAALFLSQNPIWRHRAILICGVLLFAAAAYLVQIGAIGLDGGSRTIVARVVLFGLASALLVLGLAASDVSATSRAGRLLSYLGDASYSIYLVHLPVMFAMFLPLNGFAITSGPALTLLCIAAAGVSVLLGCLCHSWLEAPLNRWATRRFVSQPTVPAAVFVPDAVVAGQANLGRLYDHRAS